MKSASPIKILSLSILLSSAALPFASVAGPVCGNNIVENPPETCDEGNIQATDTCTNLTVDHGFSGNTECTKTFCGDFVTQATNGFGFTEACDEGPVTTATCTDMCDVVTTTTTTAAPTTTTAAPTTTTAAPTTTTAAPTTTTAAPTTTTAAPTTTTAAPTTTTAAPTTTTAAATTTTGAATTTTAAATTTTGAATTTTAAATTTTAAATTTTAAATTTTAGTTTTTIAGGTVVIDGCDTGVANARLQAAINACEAKFSNKPHGKFVTCVERKAKKLKRDGDINGKQKGRINSCAAESSIGK